MNATSWQNIRLPRFPRLKASTHFDVVVIGAGITGLTAAYLLREAGKSVCVLERRRIGSGDTACTTAHLTYVTDERLTALAKNFGKDQARLVWQGGAAAINLIEHIASAEHIECDFRRVPGFLHAPLDSKRDTSRQFQSEAELAQELGFDARFVSSVPLARQPGIRFSNQAKFHPMKYLAGLATHVHRGNCVISEGSDVDEIEDDPLVVRAGKLRIECDFVVIATHVPLMGKTGLLKATLFQTKLYPYSSYVVAAKIPSGRWPEMSLWDTSDPYNYLRIDRGGRHDEAIFGGADHKTGQEVEPNDQFLELGRRLKELLPEAKIDRHWSGQVIETNDGLPFIGETAERQFAATGFAGNGITFGTLAGLMARDAAQGRINPWQELFSPRRKKLRGGTWEYLKENVDYPYYYLKDRLMPAEGTSVREVKRDGGKVLKLDGERVACSRDSGGKATLVSPYCTHMGCLVHWNELEKTWDCPCHGSRFKPGGEVLAGPAETPLEPVDMPVAKKQANAAAQKPQRRRSAARSKGRK